MESHVTGFHLSRCPEQTNPHKQKAHCWVPEDGRNGERWDDGDVLSEVMVMVVQNVKCGAVKLYGRFIAASCITTSK